MCVLDLPRFWSKKRTFSALKSTVIIVDRYLAISDRFLGAHNCFDRIGARPAVAS